MRPHVDDTTGPTSSPALRSTAQGGHDAGLGRVGSSALHVGASHADGTLGSRGNTPRGFATGQAEAGPSPGPQHRHHAGGTRSAPSARSALDAPPDEPKRQRHSARRTGRRRGTSHALGKGASAGAHPARERCARPRWPCDGFAAAGRERCRVAGGDFALSARAAFGDASAARVAARSVGAVLGWGFVRPDADQIADSGASARRSELELCAVADDTVEARLLIDERTGPRRPPAPPPSPRPGLPRSIVPPLDLERAPTRTVAA